jgi:hypothetical protein
VAVPRDRAIVFRIAHRARAASAMTVRARAKRTTLSTAGGDVSPAGFGSRLASPLHNEAAQPSAAIRGATMQTDTFDTIASDQLVRANGGISAAASWIMQHESGGSTTAGHLHSVGRGDGTQGNQSSAFGAFQMIQSTRRQYMGADYQSTDFAKQYAAASHYVSDRYGSWDGAKSFWQKHHWY